MRPIRLLSILATLAISAVALGQSVYSDTYVIPAVGHVMGANITLWMSDVAITNFSSTPLTVQLVVIERGEFNPDNVFPLVGTGVNGSISVPANSTVLLRDVLNGYRGMQNASGALLLGADRPFAVTSRAYSSTGSSVGTTVTPARDFFQNATGQTDNSAVAIVPGIINNAVARTNLGFVAGVGSGGTGNTVVQVTIKDGGGNVVATKALSLAPGSFVDTQFSVSSLSTKPFDIGSAEFRILSGSGTVIPYASVIDNATNSPSYIMGQFPAATSLSGTNGQNLIFRTLLGSLFYSQH